MVPWGIRPAGWSWLLIALAGCRFGAYAGSIRGRGVATVSDPTGVPDTRDASVDLGSYEMTGDWIHQRLVVMTAVGGGGMQTRSRTVGATPTFDSHDTSLDLHGSAGVGYQVLRTEAVLVTVFGMFSRGIFTLDDQSDLSNRLTAGLEVDLAAGSDARYGASLRLGYVHAEGTLVNLDIMARPLAVDALLLQLGVFLAVDRD
jgi:hypothetical protein